MLGETVFQQIAMQTGWIIFFLIVIIAILSFKGNGIPWHLSNIYKVFTANASQLAEMKAQIEFLRVAALASYEAQYATWKALQIRSDAAAKKRGETVVEESGPPSPETISKLFEQYKTKPQNS